MKKKLAWFFPTPHPRFFFLCNGLRRGEVIATRLSFHKSKHRYCKAIPPNKMRVCHQIVATKLGALSSDLAAGCSYVAKCHSKDGCSSLIATVNRTLGCSGQLGDGIHAVRECFGTACCKIYVALRKTNLWLKLGFSLWMRNIREELFCFLLLGVIPIEAY